MLNKNTGLDVVCFKILQDPKALYVAHCNRKRFCHVDLEFHRSHVCAIRRFKNMLKKEKIHAYNVLIRQVKYIEF